MTKTLLDFSARPGNEDGILADLMMNPRGLSVKGRAKRLSRGRPQREQSAVALSLVRLLGSPVEEGDDEMKISWRERDEEEEEEGEREV